MNLWLTILLLVNSVTASHPANILVVLPWPWYSHTNNYMPIFRGLAARGHNVTLVSPFPQTEPIPNLTEIVVPNFHEELMDLSPKPNLVGSFGLWYRLFGIWQVSIKWMNFTLNQDIIKKLIADTSSRYDLIVLETWFKQEPLVAFGHKYNAPVINIASKFLTPLAAHLTGNQLPPSYVPVQNLPYTDHMRFMQRAVNVFQYYWDVIFGHFYYLRIQETIMREHFNYPGSETLPPLADMLSNTSLTLAYCNSIAVNSPTPFLKNIVEFGGMHVAIETKKLPNDLQQIMDNAEGGVVYFSIGSYTNLSMIEEKLQLSLISAFGKLEHKVLMKLETTNPFINKTKPNMFVRPWFPQSSILAHPRCKLFITHCGIGGLMEGIYHGVPMLGIPLFADQKTNAPLLEYYGIGQVINPADVTEEKLLLVIKEMFNNSKYKANINKRSAILKDTPIDLLDNVIYWIEYVIRHKGAPHLRPAVLDLHWYQYLMLDVIVFYLLIITIILYLIKTIMIVLYKRILNILVKMEDFGQSELKSKLKLT